MPQLLVIAYEILAEPEAIPVTFPLVLTVAIDELLLVQVPPVTVEVKAVDEETQTEDAPLNVPASGSGLTVTGSVAKSVPQLLDT